jgi:hypothetical protein
VKSIAEVDAEVLAVVFTDTDRSTERTVELAVRAGIAQERERMREILELAVPPARGIETAVRLMALAGHSPDEVKSTVEFLTANTSAEDVARHRREEFRVVGRSHETACPNAPSGCLPLEPGGATNMEPA